MWNQLSRVTVLSAVILSVLPTASPLWAASYTIPGTGLQIQVNDPNGLLTADQINQKILPFLATYPPVQLQNLKTIEVKPGTGGITASNSSIILLVGSGAFDFTNQLPLGYSYFLQRTLPVSQQNQFSSYPALGLSGPGADVLNFSNLLTSWTKNTQQALVNMIKVSAAAADPGYILSQLFIGGTFIDWLAKKITTYINGTPSTSDFTFDGSVFSFAGFQITFNSKQQITSIQGAGQQYTFTTPVTLPGTLAGLFNSTPANQVTHFQRGSTEIAIIQDNSADGSFTPSEYQAMVSVLNGVPASHLDGITTIVTLPSSKRPASLPAGQNWVVQGSTITFYLPSAAQRVLTPEPVIDELTTAVGAHLYSTLAPGSTQATDWKGDANGFATLYDNWVNHNDMLGAYYLAAFTGNAQALSDALYMASFFIDKSKQTIQFYQAGSTQTLVGQNYPVVRTADELSFGGLRFQLSGDQVTAVWGWKICYPFGWFIPVPMFGWCQLSTPITLPPSLLAQLPAAPSSSAPAANAQLEGPVSRQLRSQNSGNVRSGSSSQIVVDPISGTSSSNVIRIESGNPAAYIPLLTVESQQRVRRTIQKGSRPLKSLKDLQDLMSPSDSAHPVLQSE